VSRRAFDETSQSSGAAWWFPVFVCLAAGAAYLNALPNGFVWDDENLIVGNPLIKSWSFLPRLLASPLQPDTAYYRPVQALTFLIEYRSFGLWPAGFHLTSMVLHGLVGLLLYRFASRLLADPGAGFCAALLFVVHPLHTEAVTYLSGRSDPLAAMFLLAALLWSLPPRRSLSSLLAFLLAVLSRESVMALVPLIVLVDVSWAVLHGEALRGGWGRRVTTRYLPYVGVVVLCLIGRHAALGRQTVPYETAAFPLGTRLLTMSTVVVDYLALVVFPAALHMERSVPPRSSPFDPAVLGAIALLGLVTVVVVRLRHRAWPLAFGWAWFILALLPVANLVPLSTFMAEHWLYVPSMGLFMPAGWGIARLGARRGRRVAGALLAVLVVGYGVRTVRRNVDWRDGRAIYEATLRFAPGSARVHTNLGRVYWMAGDPAAAMREFTRAIELRPDDRQTADAYNHRGIIYTQANRPEEAIAEFRRAIELAPRNPVLYVNLSLALQSAGRTDDGRRALEDALALDPRNAIAHSNLGNISFNRGDLADARRHYLQALALDPELADAHNNLGSVYLRQGRPDLAEPCFRRALALDPRHDLARRNLAAALQARGVAVPP
jgi:Flp pilus assembly protein TadD